ncbi:MAG: anthranilate phosphoribosyltransferase [Candidatus Jordarchaeum sp.]|uniref:anthranilate phosphoribosyltransferase n=1 Tax=Candidatus Jordarchaeum sp. TaxID=2823881 RepID=UPI00404A6A9D
MIKQGLQKLVEGRSLENQEARDVMKEIMSGGATSAQIGAFLTALRIKGETVQEISAFAAVMREFCCRIYPKVNGRLVDTCGTGGDQMKTFNVSTAAAFVVAGTGITVAKHGNRSVTSRSGSSDVLEKLGFNLNLEPKAVEKIIENVGIGFMFAPNFHPAMKHAIGPRREIGIRTVFNILGPLTNPAGANAQVLGVYSEELLEPLAYVLRELGCEEAMVVYGVDGLDEISIIGKTLVAQLREGEVSLTEITPKDFGFRIAKPEEIIGTTPEESAELTFKLLNGKPDAQDSKRNMVLLNSAAGVLVGGKADDLKEGIELATESMESGAAYKKLKTMIKASCGQLSKLEEYEMKYG